MLAVALTRSYYLAFDHRTQKKVWVGSSCGRPGAESGSFVNRHGVVVYNTQAMRSFRSRQFAHYASLVAAAALLCGGIFLSWPANGSEVPNIHAKADAYQVAHGTNGDEHPPNGGYLVPPAEEAGDGNRGPVDADLLTALLLTFFVTTVGWLLAYDQGRGILCSSSITRRPPHLASREGTPFLGVFRL